MLITLRPSFVHVKVQKRDNYVKEDLVSQLPEEILISILSLLSVVEARSTCVLSKRWRNLWTYVSNLNLDVQKKLIAIEKEPELIEVEIPKYINWVNQVLGLHQGLLISVFRVCFSLDCSNSCDIDNWINFAIGKRVQRLEVDLSGGRILGFPYRCGHYTLSEKVYSHIRSPYGLSCIKSLTHLYLKSVNVTGELVEHFLLNCPLERLSVSGSQHLVNLKVIGPSLRLKFLEISLCSYLESVDIYASKLASFIYLGALRETRIVVRHAPSLVDMSVGDFCKSITYAFCSVSSYFPQLQSLTLCMHLRKEMDGLPKFPKLTNLKNLTLEVFANGKDSLLDWASLIERSPFLHRFTLQYMTAYEIRKYIRRPTKHHIMHKCLKVVEFIGNIDFELYMYFIENAISLEKIIVDCAPIYLRPWEDYFEETEWMTELRERALEFKREVPHGVEFVVLPAKLI